MKRFLNLFVLLAFCFSNLNGYAQSITGTKSCAPTLNLLPVSQPVSHSVLKGVKVNPDNLFDLEFIIDTNNDSKIDKEEAQVLVNYFFAGLTLPEKDLWVNLSPYEQNRIIPDTTATTELGEGLLKEDYLLKQLAASLTYPESAIGKKYWDEINNVGATRRVARNQNDVQNTRASHRLAPTQSFNKIWITPDKALVYEHGNSAFITEATLKVLTEEDYLAMNQNGVGATRRVARNTNDNDVTRASHRLAPTESFKQHILPSITQQVNQGEHFSQLRQIYNALILGVWFKNKLKDSIYKNYIAQAKTNGIDLADSQAKEKIYQKYLAAFKQGAYNYVKKEQVNCKLGNAGTRITRRAYFSGGVGMGEISASVRPSKTGPKTTGREKAVKVTIHPVHLFTRAVKGFYRDTTLGQIGRLEGAQARAEDNARLARMRQAAGTLDPIFEDSPRDHQDRINRADITITALRNNLENIDDPREFGRHINVLLKIAEGEGAVVKVLTGGGLDGIYKTAAQFAKEKTGQTPRLPDKDKVRILTVDLVAADGPATDILKKHFKSLEGINYYRMHSDNPDILVMKGDERNPGLMAHELVEANNMQLRPAKRHRLACRESGYGDPKDARRFEKNSLVGAGRGKLTADELTRFLGEGLQSIEGRLGVHGVGNMRRGDGPLMSFDLEPKSAFVAVKFRKDGFQLRIVAESRYISGMDHDRVNAAFDVPWSACAGTPQEARRFVTEVCTRHFETRRALDKKVKQGESAHEMRVVVDAEGGKFFFGDQDPEKVFADEEIFSPRGVSGRNGAGASVRQRGGADKKAGDGEKQDQAIHGSAVEIMQKLADVFAESAEWLEGERDQHDDSDTTRIVPSIDVTLSGVRIEINQFWSTGWRPVSKEWGYEELGFSEAEWQAVAEYLTTMVRSSQELRNHCANVYSEGMYSDSSVRIATVADYSYDAVEPLLTDLAAFFGRVLSKNEGGAMGRWEWGTCKVTRDGGKVIVDLNNATRIPNKDRSIGKGGVEEEFLIDGENSPRPLRLIGEALPPEQQARAEELLQDLGMENVEVYRFSGEAARFYRDYGLAVMDSDGKKIVILRGEYLEQPDNDIPWMALWHERGELNPYNYHFLRTHERLRRQAQDPRNSHIAADAKLRAFIRHLSDADKAWKRATHPEAMGQGAGESVDGGIKVTQDTINLQTSGKGNDFQVNGNTAFEYVTLIPQVVSLRDLRQGEFRAMLQR